MAIGIKQGLIDDSETDESEYVIINDIRRGGECVVVLCKDLFHARDFYAGMKALLKEHCANEIRTGQNYQTIL